MQSQARLDDNILLDVSGLKKYYPITKGILRRTVGYVKAVDDVTFKLRVGETLGLVGESGCGKTTAGRTIMRLYDPTGGVVNFRSRVLGDGKEERVVNLSELEPARMKTLRQDGWLKVLNGMTTIDEVGRTTAGDIS